MKLLYGTGNPAKLSVMRKRLKELGIELIGLHDLDNEIPSVPDEALDEVAVEDGFLDFFRNLLLVRICGQAV